MPSYLRIIILSFDGRNRSTRLIRRARKSNDSVGKGSRTTNTASSASAWESPRRGPSPPPSSTSSHNVRSLAFVARASRHPPRRLDPRGRLQHSEPPAFRERLAHSERCEGILLPVVVDSRHPQSVPQRKRLTACRSKLEQPALDGLMARP